MNIKFYVNLLLKIGKSKENYYSYYIIYYILIKIPTNNLLKEGTSTVINIGSQILGQQIYFNIFSTFVIDNI